MRTLLQCGNGFLARSMMAGALVAGLTMLGNGCAKQSPHQVTHSNKPANTTSAMPGAAVYVKNCKVCHAQGLNGAPILANKAMWAPRIGQGEDTLVLHAMHGFGLMPANLGRNDLTEKTIRQAVQYMLEQYPH